MGIFMMLMSALNFWIAYNVFLIAPLVFQILAVGTMGYFTYMFIKTFLEVFFDFYFYF